MWTTFLLLCSLLFGYIRASECPPNFEEINSNCYWIRTDLRHEVNWYKADMMCREKRANLIYIESEEEFKIFSERFMAQNCTNTLPACRFWTGGNCFIRNRMFLWHANAKKLERSYFNKGEPNNIEKEEKCIDFRYDRQTNNSFGLADAPCLWTHGSFICKISVEKSTCFNRNA
ncbi:C-type lectin 37Da-like [Scaptodrosophila lebanonensis]|uniref:C-type lectin 37Da-like n=1 Tax=Drosophila lebanonensis TaxID=7225 RepID=A0A6J2TI74_DROLE|nr:C-type lectin 37Da-like [Scaptodrosophila lebanonensis]